MHPNFLRMIEQLHPNFEVLMKQDPVTEGMLPHTMPLKGVYLFSENGLHLYVGRSRNMRRRYGMHTRESSGHYSASFAFRLAKEARGITGVSYKSDAYNRQGLSEQFAFQKQFTEEKKRVRLMEFRFVEETDPTRQAILEIYCALALETPYNNFDTH